MRIFLACLVTAAAALAATAAVAHACSCAPPEPRRLLAEADGAFVGRLEERRELGNGRALFTFRVERSVKGRLGATVDVETSVSGASCGIETTVGSRIGLFLERRDARWTSSLCWQLDADELLAAAGPLPPPTGRGPVTLLVGSRFGPVRTIALDALGRTLAYGRGKGTVTHISVCPGARRIVEAVELGAGPAIAIRTLPGLRIIRQRRVSPPQRTFLSALRCETPDGSRLLVFHSSADWPPGARLERLTGGRDVLIWQGTAIGATLTSRTAYVTAGRRGTRLIAVDVGTRRVRQLGRILPPFGPLAADPSGTRLAGVVSTEGARRWLATVRLAPFRVVTTRLADPGDVAWVDSKRLVFFSEGGQIARVYTGDLRPVSSFTWTAYRSVATGSTAYGVAFDGLHRAALPRGPERVLGKMPSGSVSVLVPLPR